MNIKLEKFYNDDTDGLKRILSILYKLKKENFINEEQNIILKSKFFFPKTDSKFVIISLKKIKSFQEAELLIKDFINSFDYDFENNCSILNRNEENDDSPLDNKLIHIKKKKENYKLFQIKKNTKFDLEDNLNSKLVKKNTT